MMICERCRNEIADNAIICPVCGTRRAQIPPQQAGNEQAYHQGDFQKPPDGYGQYARGYQGGYPPPPPQQAMNQQNYQGYQGYVPPQQPYGYTPPYSANPGYPSAGINVTIVNNSSSGKNDGALIAEIIFSLFGVFGIGWLIGGETTIGVVLLICSFLLYWPIMFFGTIFTLGFGLIFLGPLMIASIIVNAVLLNNALKRKATPFVIVQQPPPMQMPPR
jgi:hypothetical protein